MKVVKRTLEDFIILRKKLLDETPELFLPTFKDMLHPEWIDLHPPPLTVIHAALKKLQSFMECLQQHPTINSHDYVL